MSNHRADTYRADERTPVLAPSSASTLVAGSDFLICDTAGDVTPGGLQGYFAGDTRLVSDLCLRIDGERPVVIDSWCRDQQLVSLATVGNPADPELLVRRVTTLGERLDVAIALRNLTGAGLSVTLDLTVGADFADLFDVKRGVEPRSGFVGSGPVGDALLLAYESNGFRRSVRMTLDREAQILRDGVRAQVEVAAQDTQTVSVGFVHDVGGGAATANARGLANVDDWIRRTPRMTGDLAGLAETWQRCAEDLGSLLLTEPARPDRPYVAAGSPWFLTLFGRDSLLTSWSALLLDPRLGLGTLMALAARQGRRYDPASEEQPGRILHEQRAGEVVLRPGGWGAVYYGSVDATPLFVMSLAEQWRWGAASEDVRDLLPAAEAAVAWMLGDGDGDGDGLVEYGSPPNAVGLVNQGWKDSADAIRQADGSLADGPIALVEVQAYCCAAFRAMGDLRSAFGTGDPGPLWERAEAIADAIDERFWLDDEGTYALALDGAGRPVRSVTSNAGHVLWARADRPGRARAVADRLLRDDMFTGWGVRTLSAGNPAYNPLSYHCGSVWPHDSALVAAGLLAAECDDEGRQLATALLAAARAFGGRPPELFGGFDARDFPDPVPYPSSCSPQAWAAASPALLVRGLLGLAPDVPRRVVQLRPRLPAGVRLELREVRVGEYLLDVVAAGDQVVDAHCTGDLRIEVS